MWVRNSVLNARPGHVDGAQLTVAGPKAALAALLLQPAQADAVIAKAGLATDGDTGVFATLATLMDTFDRTLQPVDTVTVPGRRRRAPGARAGRVDGPLRPRADPRSSERSPESVAD